MKLTIRCTSGLRIRFEGSSAELEHFDAFLSELAVLEHARLAPGRTDGDHSSDHSRDHSADPSPPSASGLVAERGADRPGTDGAAACAVSSPGGPVTADPAPVASPADDPPAAPPAAAATPAGGGRAVDLLAHDDHPATRRLHTVPRSQLLTDAAAEPAEVADHDPGVLPAFDALDRGEQTRSLLDRQAATDVQLGWQNNEARTDTLGFALKVGDLVAVGVEAVAAAAAEIADADEARPRKTAADHPGTLTGERAPKVLWGSVT